MKNNEIKKWKELSRREILPKRYGRGVDHVTFELPDGERGEFYIKEESNPICILALTEDHHVILATQFRQGPQKIFHELPGGGIEEGETPEQAAIRELREETGYEGEMKFIGRSYEDAYVNLRRHCFVATNCKKIYEQDLDEQEFITVTLMTLSEFRGHLRSGNLTDIEVGYMGLDHLGLL